VRRRSWLAILVALVAAPLQGAGSVLPEMSKHLDFGRRCAARGDHSGATACSQLILLERIRVYVDDKNATAAAKKGLASAVKTWTAAVGGEVQFAFVESRIEAQVVVSFERTLGDAETAYGGFTRWKRKLSSTAWSLDAQMQLRTHTPTGVPMTADQVHHAALHEFGHVLGLDDSSTQGDAMGPLDLRHPVSTPKSGELAKLNGLRDEARMLKRASRSVRSSR
jgi:hypothetical protein